MKTLLGLLAATTLASSLPFRSPGLDYPSARVTIAYGEAKDVSGPASGTYYATPEGDYLGYEAPFKEVAIG